MALSENSKSIISFWPGAKEEEERKEKELLKTRVRELEEEVGENWVVPLKMLILGLLRLTIMAIIALLTKYLGPKTFQSSILLSMETQGGKIERTRKEIGRNAGSGQKSGFLIKKRTPLSISPFFSILSSFPSTSYFTIFYQGDVMIYKRFGFHSFYIGLNVYRHMN